MLGLGKERLAGLVVVAVLLWQAGAGVLAEGGRLASATLGERIEWLGAGDEPRYRATLGEGWELLSAVHVHAPDASRLVLIGNRSARQVAQLTTLLFPVEVLPLERVPEDAATLAQLLDRTTYVLVVAPAAPLPRIAALAVVSGGPGWTLLRYDPEW